MSESLISKRKRCLVCGTTIGLHRHHIFGGSADRTKSEIWGCWCYLCYKHHNGSNEGIHFDKQLNESVKARCQKAFERKYGKEKFIEVFGKNYERD